MLNRVNYFNLGASLYVPCTRPDLLDIANGTKLIARSFIFCLEDAVREDELALALDNLAETLDNCQSTSNSLRFIRVRNLAIMDTVMRMPGIHKFDGFVLPKATRHNILDYAEIATSSDTHVIMPTLETAEVFDLAEMTNLRDLVLKQNWHHRVLAWRIGGNDLMSLLGVRRSRVRTLYESPLMPTLAGLSTTFKAYGFNLTAPVFEIFDNRELLVHEVARDIEFGFLGKTAVHPDQIPHIEAQYKVTSDEVAAAYQIVAEDAPAVFRLNGAMCEPATHRVWALGIITRAETYGIWAP